MVRGSINQTENPESRFARSEGKNRKKPMGIASVWICILRSGVGIQLYLFDSAHAGYSPCQNMD
jgi:hypothetical protein